MPITYRDGANNRNIAQAYYQDGGTRRTLTAIYYQDGANRRSVLAAVNLQGLDPTDTESSPTNAVATFTLTSAGAETATGRTSGTWLSAGSGGDYDVRVTMITGSLSSGTVGIWVSLGSNRSWQIFRNGGFPGTTSASMTVEIRHAASGVVIASKRVDFTATIT